MIEIKNIDEVVERLICNQFIFKIEDNKLIFESPERKESDNSLFGFHYCGVFKKHYFVLDYYNVSDIIYGAFYLYKTSIAKAIKEKINKTLEELE